MLTTEKGHHPVCIGPGILHKQKRLTSYKTLPLIMTKYRRETTDVLVFCTDGKENLYSAMAEVFVNAKHLRCDNHLKDNVKRKLNELGIGRIAASEIFFDIFGKGMGNVAEGGLANCKSTEEFDAAFEGAMKNWMADVIRNCCTAEIRSMCGLGFPPKVYNQNASDCMNRLVKAEDDSKYGKKATGHPPAIEHN